MQLNDISKALAEMRDAFFVYVPNPMAVDEIVTRRVPAGTIIRDLDPKGRYPAICRLNGAWTLRKDWDQPLLPGQVVEFHEYPQGGGNGNGGSNVGRIILTIAAIYIAYQFGYSEFATSMFGAGNASLVTAISAVVLTSLVNALVPVNAANVNELGSGGSTANTNYSTNLAANQARLEQPIPVLYGRNKTFPDFAAQPYSMYDPDNDNQYYHALLCQGQGHYYQELLTIDDTDINVFKEIKVNFLKPGEPPTFVHPNVINVVEVTGNELVFPSDASAGTYVGPFIGCRARSKTKKIDIDISCSRGLATFGVDGTPGVMNVNFRIEYRAVDDFGRPASNWAVLAQEILRRSQSSPVRKTYTYNLPKAIRPQVRIIRTNRFEDNNRVANVVEWAGWRCYLEDPAPLCATATYIEVRMLASQQLNGLTQRKIGSISRRLLPVWHPGTGWSEPVQTRNPAWALADKWRNKVYGDGYEEGQYDLDTLYTLSQTWDTRQDRFDGVFDQTYDSFAADQMIAATGRAAVFRRYGVVTVTRDEPRDMPVTAFTSRNILPGSVSIDYHFATEATPDGVLVEYLDNRTWDWDTSIVIPLPGVVTPVRPQRMKLFGVTGETHARREGTYQAYNAFFRRKYPSFSTELEGMLPSFGSAVVFAPSFPGWGRGGDVVEYNDSTHVMQLSEPPVWKPDVDHYISFVKRNGALSVPIRVVQGPSSNEVKLQVAPTMDFSLDDSSSERTRYVFGVSTPYEAVMRVLSLTNSADSDGVRTFTVGGLIEDNRVHTADQYLLPNGTVIQDPIDPAGTAGGGGGPGDDPIPGGGGISDADPVVALPWFLTGVSALPQSAAGFRLRPDGTAQSISWLTIRPYTRYTTLSWWLITKPVAPSSLYEARVTVIEGETPTGAAVDTWLNLNVDRQWKLGQFNDDTDHFSTLKLEIREVATGIILAEADPLLLYTDGAPLS